MYEEPVNVSFWFIIVAELHKTAENLIIPSWLAFQLGIFNQLLTCSKNRLHSGLLSGFFPNVFFVYRVSVIVWPLNFGWWKWRPVKTCYLTTGHCSKQAVAGLVGDRLGVARHWTDYGATERGQHKNHNKEPVKILSVTTGERKKSAATNPEDTTKIMDCDNWAEKLAVFVLTFNLLVSVVHACSV